MPRPASHSPRLRSAVLKDSRTNMLRSLRNSLVAQALPANMPGEATRGCQLGEAECARVPEGGFSSLVLRSPQSKQKPRERVHSPGACSLLRGKAHDMMSLQQDSGSTRITAPDREEEGRKWVQGWPCPCTTLSLREGIPGSRPHGYLPSAFLFQNV